MPGVTAPCLTINGPDGSLYNITAASPKPPLNGPHDPAARDRERQAERLHAGHRARSHPLDAGTAEVHELNR